MGNRGTGSVVCCSEGNKYLWSAVLIGLGTQFAGKWPQLFRGLEILGGSGNLRKIHETCMP